MHYLEMNRQPFNLTIRLEKNMFSKHVDSIRENIDSRSGRTEVSIQENSEDFIIYIGASDIVSLRAVMGSIQKWLVIADRIIKGE
jgi:tRNA threonylcarbamoyladenosine modification (KEOPS) complex  Pcc1 subunit